MKSILVLTMTAVVLLFSFGPVSAEEALFSGDVSLMGVLVDVDGNHAKYNEYGDIRDGLYGRARLLYDDDAYFLHLAVKDVGYDTQSYRLNGAVWEGLKFNFYYAETPHNITFGAVTPLSGTGTDYLTLAPHTDPSDPATWRKRFDYSTERKLLGGEISLDVAKPFFLTLSASTERKEGIKPAGIAMDVDEPANPSLEIPEPIDYTTREIRAIAGYSKPPLFLSAGFLYSDFDNHNGSLNINCTSCHDQDGDRILGLPPDNQYYKFFFQGGLKLPYNSKLNVNVGHGVAKSDSNLLLSDFNGKIVTTNVDAAFTTNPVSFLDAKLFMKHYDYDNQSDIVTVVDANNSPFEYRKNSFGGELGFRLPERLYLSAGYSYVDTERNFTAPNPDAILADTKDHIFEVDLNWRGTDFIAAKVGYERLNRDSDFQQDSASRNFDLAAKDRDYYKARVDVYPVDNLSVGLEYLYKDTDYKDLQFGMKSDRRHEVVATVDYTLAKLLRLFAYGDYEEVKYEQFQSTLDNTNWRVAQKEKNYDFGVGADVFIVPKTLTLKLQYDYMKAQGSADFRGPAITGINNPNITNWDNYKKNTYLAKVIYDITRSLAVSAGYAYEKFTYSDAQLNGYTLVVDSNAFLTGAFRDQSYKASLLFASLTYRF